MHLAKSSFPELGYSTNPLHILLQSLALSLASLTQYAQSIYNYHLAQHHTDPTLELSHSYSLHRLNIYLSIQHGPTFPYLLHNPKSQKGP